MKKSFFLTVLCMNFLFVVGQIKDFGLNFDDAQYLDHLIIDTIQYPENTWQVGPPQKPEFGPASSLPNALVTDTLNTYPANNTSVFMLMDFVWGGYYYGVKMISGDYFVQSDSLHDYGSFELSADKGATWIDLLNDTSYSSNIQWFVKPVLTGNSFGWKYFDLMLSDIGSIFNLQPGDTVRYRFTFTSDNNPDGLGGLMFDNICVYELIEGVSETRFKPLKSVIYPNPSPRYFTIDFENPADALFELSIYDGLSKRMILQENIPGNSVALDANDLKAGLYFYKLTNNNQKERSWGKFVVTD